MEASPKRRALGSLDPNASSLKPQLGFKQLKPAVLSAPGSSPLKRAAETTSEPEPKKRQLTMEPRVELPPARKPSTDESGKGLARETCVAPDAATNPPQQQSPRPSDRQRSASPAVLSLFDSSGLDNTQGTAITEPDDAAAPTARAAPHQPSYSGVSLPLTRPRLTREETREKAEILRLRLGLANYKLRTGQTDVPLERLQMRPLPRVTSSGAAARTPPPASSSNASQQAIRKPLPGAPARRNSEQGVSEPDNSGLSSSSQESSSTSNSQDDGAVPDQRDSKSPERLSLPRLPAQPGSVHTPRRMGHLEDDTERLTSSALRGGAVNGLLSLARG